MAPHETARSLLEVTMNLVGFIIMTAIVLVVMTFILCQYEK